MSTTTLVPNSHSQIVTRTTPQLQSSLLQRLSAQRFRAWLQKLQHGTIALGDQHAIATTELFGQGDLTATWQIDSPKFYSHLATGGSLGVAESWMQGHWQTDDLTTLLRILCRNLERMPTGTSAMATVSRWLKRAAFLWHSNTRRASRRHIAAHYDLSNEFFELFLDRTMMYSSAYFEHPRKSLHDASVAKLDQICGKLDLRSSDQVLEIGTGWGGFSLHAATSYGCHITTTTISDAQLQRARQRVESAGLADRVELLNSDYRDLEGQYDKIVSIEMVEAVGERYLDAYFRKCGQLLKPGGRMVIQAIVMPEQRYDSYRRSVDFIQQYIFPGGFLPSVAAIQNSVGRTSCLRLQSIEDMAGHYAKTLREWRLNFHEQIDQVQSLGFDDRFIRMWEYYLCYCEAAFLEQAVKVVQIAWDKPRH